MSALAGPEPMVRRNDVTVKLDAELVRQAKIVAAYRDVPLAAYLSDALRSIVAADLVAEQDRERKGRAPHPKKSRGADPDLKA